MDVTDIGEMGREKETEIQICFLIEQASNQNNEFPNALYHGCTL
jgi:hypothetical protein